MYKSFSLGTYNNFWYFWYFWYTRLSTKILNFKILAYYKSRPLAILRKLSHVMLQP